MILHAVTQAVTGFDVDYATLEPLGPEELGALLASRGLEYRHRIVHHMVLAEIVLTPLPVEVANRVARWTPRRWASPTTSCDLPTATPRAPSTWRRSICAAPGSSTSGTRDARPRCTPGSRSPIRSTVSSIQTSAARWERFATLDEGTLGRAVWTMYQTRGFQTPGTVGAASAYLAQHDFVHVLSDYGTRMECELEVFALVGRADPDPKGFAWLATMVGLFETGYVESQGPFNVNVEQRHLQLSGMDIRLADAIRRGKVIAEHYGQDLLEVDYHELAEWPVDDVRSMLGVPPKSADAIAVGSPGVFDPGGISDFQRAAGQRLA